jgi:hypothetical protein
LVAESEDQEEAGLTVGETVFAVMAVASAVTMLIGCVKIAVCAANPFVFSDPMGNIWGNIARISRN